MNRLFACYAALAASVFAILVLPYPDHSGHGICASILAVLALLTTLACIALATLNIVRDKALSSNLGISLLVAVAPFAQLLLSAIFKQNLSLEDISGITWMACGLLSELCAVSLLITLAIRRLRNSDDQVLPPDFKLSTIGITINKSVIPEACHGNHPYQQRPSHHP